jgi:hypothetical protein
LPRSFPNPAGRASRRITALPDGKRSSGREFREMLVNMPISTGVIRYGHRAAG